MWVHLESSWAVFLDKPVWLNAQLCAHMQAVMMTAWVKPGMPCHLIVIQQEMRGFEHDAIHDDMDGHAAICIDRQLG